MAGNVTIVGLDELTRKLSNLPRFAIDAAADETAKYLLNVFKQYPPVKRVSRKAAYGRSFQSARQRRWFFWALDAGAVHTPYRRTQATQRGWKIIGSGSELIVANETDGAYYSMDDQGQARLNKLVGWKKTGDIVRERSGEIRRKAEAGVKKAMRRAGL